MISLQKMSVVILLLFVSTFASAEESIKLKANKALFSLEHHSVPVITSSLVAWDTNWKWSGTRITSISNSDSHEFKGTSQNLDLSLLGHTSSGKNHHAWHYQFSASKPHPTAIGYGISFKLNLNSPSFKGLSKEPELLANNSGWRWQISPEKTVEVHFSPKLAKVYFERGNKNEIRAMFSGAIEVGVYDFDMTVTVNGIKTLAVEYPALQSKKSTLDWQKNNIPWDVSPVDMSFLNANHIPAGKHGVLVAKGDALEFADGTPVKFWGANIQAYALFKTSDANIKQQAKRLSRLGFNLVRIHHHDSAWVNPNIFAAPKKDTLTLNESSLKKLDWWIKCLKEEGIYIWMDLQVGRAYTAADGISDFAEIAKGKARHSLKGFNYYNQSIQMKMMDFNAVYLNHVNPFTKLAYKDEPAIVSTLLINENDLTQHFGNALLPNKKVPQHSKLYMADAKQTAEKLHLNPKQAWRSWEFGDSKIYLNDAEHRFNTLMLSHLTNLGVKSPLVPGNTWGGMSLAGLPSLTDGDIIDVHSYGREGELFFNPRYRAGFLSWIGAGQVSGKPLSVTEWNLEKFPVSDRYTAPTWLASVAALQGWDSLMLYGYSQSPLNAAGRGGNYSTYNDPALMAMMPAAALLYRQGHVAPAKNSYHIRLSKDDFFNQSVTPVTSASIRTLLEQSKVSIDLPYSSALPWLAEHEKKMDASYTDKSFEHHVVSDPNIDFIESKSSVVVSDTHELKRNWKKGIHFIDSAKSQLVSGKIGGETIQLGDVKFSIGTVSASVAVQSLDNMALNDSSKILISKIARCIPVNQKNKPFACEPVIGELYIKAKSGLSLYQINSDSSKDKIVSEYSNETGYKVLLSAKVATPWLVLE